MARGEWSEAAAAWRSRGYPYETALAQVLSDDVAAQARRDWWRWTSSARNRWPAGYAGTSATVA